MSDTTWRGSPPHMACAASDAPITVPATVLVAADDLVEREGLAHMLAQGDTSIVGLVRSLPDLLGALSEPNDAKVCVIDFGGAPARYRDGEVVEAIRAVRCDLAVVLLTRDVDPDLARTVAEPSTVGLGYVRRGSLRRARDLQRWVADVAAGGVVLDHTIAAELVRFRHAEDRIEGLSDLDHTIGDLMALGATDHAIALQLGVPLAVVRNATRKLSRQLDVTGDPLVNRRVRTVVSWLRHRQQTVAS